MKKRCVIQVQDLKNSRRDFARDYQQIEKGKKMNVQKMTFANGGLFRKFLTEKRLELIKIIKEKKPRSIKEIERLTNRDYKSINIDLSVLKEIGILDMIKENNRVMPRIKFDEISVKIPLKAMH